MGIKTLYKYKDNLMKIENASFARKYKGLMAFSCIYIYSNEMYRIM